MAQEQDQEQGQEPGQEQAAPSGPDLTKGVTFADFVTASSWAMSAPRRFCSSAAVPKCSRSAPIAAIITPRLPTG